jgi:hypothetical protein
MLHFLPSFSQLTFSALLPLAVGPFEKIESIVKKFVVEEYQFGLKLGESPSSSSTTQRFC